MNGGKDRDLWHISGVAIMSIPFIIFLICFIILFLIRIPIGFGMIMVSFFYFLFSPDLAPFSTKMVPQYFLNGMMSNFVMLAVPLFILMAEIMNSGKITDMVFKFANSLIGRRHGALGHVNVVASIIFSGMTGSAVADASGLGSLEFKAMKDHGYDDGFSCAITAASSTIGPIFPPSIPMIFYSMLSGASVGALFVAGMLPGLLIGVALMVYIAVIAKRRGFPLGDYVPFAELLTIFLKAFPALFSVIILLGGIYTGFVTPTEAGALASAYAIIVSVFFYRALGFREFIAVLRRTAITTGSLTVIVGAAYIFSYIIAIEGVGVTIADFLTGITTNKYALLIIINIVFLILGMFVDTMCIILIFIPIVLPLVNELGIDLVHFGVVVVLNMMIGLATPPFGILLFSVSGISGTPLRSIIKEILPMLAVLIAVLLMVTFFEPLTLFLPHMIGY